MALTKSHKTLKGRYRLYRCSHCYHIFEWLGDRDPNFCPECGNKIYAKSFDVNCTIDSKVLIVFDIDREEETDGN